MQKAVGHSRWFRYPPLTWATNLRNCAGPPWLYSQVYGWSGDAHFAGAKEHVEVVHRLHAFKMYRERLKLGAFSHFVSYIFALYCRCLVDLIWRLCGNFTKDMLNSLAKEKIEKTEIKVIVEKSLFLHNQRIIGWLNWGIERYREARVSVWRKCQLVLIWNHISLFLLRGFLGMCPFTFQRLCLHQKKCKRQKKKGFESSMRRAHIAWSLIPLWIQAFCFSRSMAQW